MYIGILKDRKIENNIKKTLREFLLKHKDCEQQLKSWHRETEKAKRKNLNELKLEYPSASILEKRIVFNIKGNKYRLVVKINFEYQIIWIRFVGTHAEYDKIDANNIKKKKI